MADSLTSILSLLQSFSSKTGTQTSTGGGTTSVNSGGTTTDSGGTSTKQTVLSQDTMNAMLKSALEGTNGTSGLADVVGGQNKAGMYNSSTNSMLTNDLLSRLATQVAVAGAPTVTTVAPSTKTVSPTTEVTAPSVKTTATTTPAAVSTGTGAAALGGTLAISALKPYVDKLLGGKGATKKLAIGAAAAASPGDASSQSAESVLAMNGENSSATADYLASTAEESITAGSSAGAEAISATSGGSDAMAATVDEAVSSTADDAVGGIVDSISEAISGALGGEAAGAAGDAVGTMIGDSFVEYGGDAMAAAASDEATSLAGEAASSWCFLTTAVCEYQLKPDNCPELDILRKFRDTWMQENYPEDIKVYYKTAPALVTKIKALPQAARVFDEMYFGFILPAIRSIKLGDMEGAYRIYKSLYNYCVGV